MHDLVARHEREIFPLLHRRWLFAEVDDFALYDFYTSDGAVNEDVFAFSNRRGDARSLVVYHNKYAETSGWIRTAAVTGASLAEGLGLSSDASTTTWSCATRTAGSSTSARSASCPSRGSTSSCAPTARTYSSICATFTTPTAAGAASPSGSVGGACHRSTKRCRDLELQPLHAALQRDDAHDALAAAAGCWAHGRQRPPSNRGL